MSVRSIFAGVVLEEVDSPYNGRMRVVSKRGERRLEVGGIHQSVWRENDDYRDTVWHHLVESLSISPERVLILGLGGGTVAHLLLQKNPHAHIIGVDIDPEVVRLGTNYFFLGLEEIDVVVLDALSYLSRRVENAQTSLFDTIIVDICKGDVLPRDLQSGRFFDLLRSSVHDTGEILFNRLSFGQHRDSAYQFKLLLDSHFSDVRTETFSGKTGSDNLLLYCRK